MTTSSAALRDVFEEALALPPGERAAFLQARCADAELRARIERMIAADADDDVALERGADVVARAIGSAEDAPALPPGTRIGAFTLLEILGEGGSSTVFRAERTIDGVRQQVALKLLRRSLYSSDAQRQFRRERIALSQLRHPGIARLIEGGISESGLAYIALDLVDGTPITDHARERRLDLRERLKLFLQVCRAVEAAHRALIVHRDLKPANVFVTADGEVKLLDFGIAKLLDAENETETRLPSFTPAYAAPEQRSGAPITTATDVYALGVLLGELVTGQRLNDGSSRSPSGQISADTAPGVLPAPAAVTRRQLRGDLDNVVLKAIANEPERRYVSAGALADDIERVLDKRPVAAVAPSTWYRTRKFVERHRGGVALTALFALGVIAALGVALWQGSVARHAAQRADAMRDFMISAFSEAEPSTPRSGPPPITDVVEQALVKARADAHMNPGVRAELVAELGAVLSAQGKIAPAREVLQWNYDRAQHDFGASARETLEAGHRLAQTLTLAGEFAPARELIDRLLANVAPGDTKLEAELRLDSARLATHEHALQRALADAEIGLRLTRGLGNDDALADALGEYGNVQFTAGATARATAAWEELLALEQRRFGPQHAKIAETEANLSRTYRRDGRLDEAEQHIRAALAIDAAVLPPEHWRRANHLNALMMVQLQRRDFAAALTTSEECLRIDRAAYGDDDHPEPANDLNSVGMLHALLEDFPAAVTPLRESLARTEKKFGAEHFETAVTRANYGVVLAHAGDVAAGEAEIEHAIASLEHASESDADEQASTWEKLARVRLDRGDAAGARPAIDRIDALVPKIDTPDAYWDGRAATLRAAALLQTHADADALRLLDAAAAALQHSPEPDAVLRVEVPLLQANAALGSADRDAAQGYAKIALPALAALRNPPHRLVALAVPLQGLDAPAH
jgi:eukaryotic-like serine/threonine-protein kinase